MYLKKKKTNISTKLFHKLLSLQIKTQGNNIIQAIQGKFSNCCTIIVLVYISSDVLHLIVFITH